MQRTVGRIWPLDNFQTYPTFKKDILLSSPRSTYSRWGQDKKAIERKEGTFRFEEEFSLLWQQRNDEEEKEEELFLGTMDGWKKGRKERAFRIWGIPHKTFTQSCDFGPPPHNLVCLSTKVWTISCLPRPLCSDVMCGSHLWSWSSSLASESSLRDSFKAGAIMGSLSLSNKRPKKRTAKRGLWRIVS